MSRVPLFEGITIRDQAIRNRIWVPAMCQYSAPDGCPTDWHFSHYSGLATSAGCVIVEATAVSQIARVTPQDLVLSAGSQCLEKYAALVRSILQRGALPGIQLSHAGRKGSRTRPWEGDAALKPADGGWQTISPSPLAFGAGYESPVEMDEVAIAQAIEEFVSSARLAYEAGFKLLEIHGGHGRLVHSFLSPVSNRRVDRYGGDLENRARFACEIARKVRAAIGEESILAFRLSCVDWCEGGLTIADSVQVARWLKDVGVDLIDCSSGGIVRPLAKRTSPGYQVPFATEIRRGAGIAAAAVGLIGSLDHAEEILEKGEADVVLLGRLLMMDPLALTRTALECGVMDAVPPQYRRGLCDASRVAAEHIPEL